MPFINTTNIFCPYHLIIFFIMLILGSKLVAHKWVVSLSGRKTWVCSKVICSYVLENRHICQSPSFNPKSIPFPIPSLSLLLFFSSMHLVLSTFKWVVFTKKEEEEEEDDNAGSALLCPNSRFMAFSYGLVAKTHPLFFFSRVHGESIRIHLPVQE